MEFNTSCVGPAWISALVNGTGRRTRRLKSFLRTSPRRFGGPSSACHIWFATEPRRAIHGLPTPNDPSLTLTRTQHAAIPGNRGNKRSLTYAGFASLCNAQQPLSTLVMSGGQRFESARRLSFLAANTVKTKSPRGSYRRPCQQYVSS